MRSLQRKKILFKIDGLLSEITKHHYTKYHEGLKNVVAIMHWPLSRPNYLCYRVHIFLPKGLILPVRERFF